MRNDRGGAAGDRDDGGGGALVVLRSTVKIGTTRKYSAVAGVHVAFCPERTLEGHALAELRSLPQIVGGVTPEATRLAAELFGQLTPTVVRVADPETAEMIKLVSNAHRDVRFAYATDRAAVPMRRGSVRRK